ncbi:MAG: hypothetical protein HKN16_12030 [Saprospiraceae bacterium]|nr:hypothetical protein [Saprospiraceae bacterium]
MKKYLVIIFFLGGFSSAFGQELLEVVTKSVQKSIPFELGSEVKIQGEKADVYLSTWDKNRIAVYLDLVASHPDKAQAEADLKKMSYQLEKKGTTILIKNVIPENEKLASRLQAKYTIILPESCPVNLDNIFGTAQIRGLNKALVVNASYCDLQLTNLNGSIDIETVFGDIKGRTISGKVNIKSAWTDMDFAKVSGTWKMNLSQGVLKIEASNSFADFDIISDQSEIYFVNPAVGLFNYEILAGLTELDLPNELNFKRTELASDLKQINLQTPSAQGSFKVKTTFGKVVIGPLSY